MPAPKSRNNCLLCIVTALAFLACPVLAQEPNAPATPPRNPMPYAGVDWELVQYVHTTTHGHQTNQDTLDRAVRSGIGFLTVSNYYPSAPWWPMKDIRENQFWMQHEHPVVVNGALTPGPFDWNAVIGDWADTLPEEQRNQLPKALGGAPFTNIPNGILEAPNAEHHSFTNTNAHACAPGSAFASGTVDVRNRFQTQDHGYAIGVGQTWEEGFSRMFAALIVPDGGGVTINHPTWSRLPEDLVFEMLDFDPRVLGIEVFNHTTLNQHGPQDWVGNEALWDTVLSTGRQCFGFFVPDHVMQGRDDWMGRNVLLVEELTVEACLRAYREGRFYGSIKGTDLRFTELRADEDAVTVKTNGAKRIEFYTEDGLAKAERAPELTFPIPRAENGAPAVTFVRVRALDGQGEIIYAQPFIYRPRA